MEADKPKIKAAQEMTVSELIAERRALAKRIRRSNVYKHIAVKDKEEMEKYIERLKGLYKRI